MSKSKKKQAKVKVTKKWMLDFANSIYNPKTKKYLNLCNDTLQNGPDPKDSCRIMHCGLGELYFAMTGKQPEDTGVTEGGVVKLAVSSSTVVDAEKAAQAKIEKFAKELPARFIENNGILEVIDEYRPLLHSLLDDIPNENDHSGTYQIRAKRVAAILREAAEYLI